MRIAVIGAGAVGGTAAALLDRAGHDVEVTARGAHAERIASHGLRLTGEWGEHVARPVVSSELQRRPELAIVATKAASAEAAMAPVARLLGGVPVLVVQNGLRGVTTARATLPDSDVIGGLAMFAASHLSPGAVEVTAAGSMCIEKSSIRNGLATLFVDRTISAVMPVGAFDDFVGAQWTKLVINQVNALPAVTGLSVQEVVAHDRLRRVLTSSMAEAVRAGLASGVRFAPLQGLSHRLLTVFERSPSLLRQALPLAMVRKMGDTPNPGSTLQSIRRNQPTEIDYLNGAVVDAGEVAGVQTPINAVLVRLVHEVEAGREFLTAGEVVAEVNR